jgi:hypothetical protein
MMMMMIVWGNTRQTTKQIPGKRIRRVSGYTILSMEEEMFQFESERGRR